MTEQLKYADQSSTDYTDFYEFEYELSQYLCWKAMTQEFNSAPEAVFRDLYDQAEIYILKAFESIIGELDVLCLEDVSSDSCYYGAAMLYTENYLDWLALAQELGIENAPEIMGLMDFCGGSITELLYNFTMINAETELELNREGGEESFKSYSVNLESTEQIIQIEYQMFNLLDELIEIDSAEIKWIDVTQWGGQEKGGFLYENGQLGMNPELRTLIGFCHPDDPDCKYFAGEFEIYRNDCHMADLRISWTR
jgi:hypothetical protein